MNLDYIKDKIKSYQFKEHTFIYKGLRNQVEEFRGIINKCYSGIFTILLFDGSIKSFSYNDVIIGNLKIK